MVYTRELLVIDNELIRKEAIARCEKLMRDLEETREVLERHQREDLPAYANWLHANFGSMLSELYRLAEEAYDLVEMLAHIQEIANEQGIDYYSAWLIARDMQAHPERYSRKEERKREEGESFTWEEPDESPRPSRAPGAAREEADTRVRELYRMLAKKLHPDYRQEGKWDDASSRLWNELQTAYEERDLGRLEAIAAMITGEAGVRQEDLSVSRIYALCAEYRKQLRSLKRTIKIARAEPSWEFTRRTDRRALYRSMKNSLSAELEWRKYEVAEHRRTLARWSTPQTGKRRRVHEDEWDDFL